MPAGIGVAHRVVQDIGQGLCETLFVADDRIRRVGHVEIERVALRVEFRPRGFDGARDDLEHLHRFLLDRELAARDAAYVEDVVDDAHQLAALAVQYLQNALAFGIWQLVQFHQVHRAADRRERIAQFVRQHGDEFVDVVARGLDGFGVFTLGHVLSHFREAAQVAGGIEQRGHDHACPVARTVLAHAPAFVLGASLPPRGGEFSRGSAGPHVFRRVKSGEMPAQDFAALVTGDPARAAVPAGDDAHRIEHVDGIVLHAFHEQAEALFALAQDFFVLPALGQVAGDLGEGQEPAIVVLEGGNHHVGPEAGTVLAHAPAFVFEAACFGRHIELVLRPAFRDVGFDVELREVLADDFVRFVLLHGPRAGIPTGHASLRVQEEDGVIAYGLRHEPVKLQRGFGYSGNQLFIGEHRKSVVRRARWDKSRRQ